MDARRRLLLFGNPLRPTWAHDFTSGVIPASATFTRATTATYFNASGVLSTATSGTPRFDHDPATGQRLGYLAEMQSTNNCIRSRTIAAHWTVTRVTATDDAVVSPDGTQNATSVIENTDTNTHFVEAPDGGSVVDNSIYGVSLFIKNISGSRWAKITLNGTGTTIVNFQPSSGTLGTLGTNVTNANARSIGNDWYRVSFNVDPDFSATVRPRINMGDSNDSTVSDSYTGDGTSGFAVWGVQVDSAGVGVTSYIPTAGSTVTRNQDVLSLPLSSLPGWDANQGGVLVAAYRLHTLVPSGGTQAIASINDGSVSNRVNINAKDGGAEVETGDMRATSFQAQLQNGSPPAVFTRRKTAIGWGTSRVFMAHDADTSTGSSGSFTLPVGPTTLDIGRFATAALNGTLESIAYYRGERPDGIIQRISR